MVWPTLGSRTAKEQEQAAITFCQACGYLRSFHQMALPVNGSTHLIPAYYSIYRPRKDERLSWPSWLTYSGRMAYPHQWSPISCRSSAGQGKFSGQFSDVLPLCHATNHATPRLHQAKASKYSDKLVNSAFRHDTTATVAPLCG